ncbi:MAG: hypothetical protein ACOC29_02335 [Candidatus Sumerlaeota bacterium]
MIISGAREVKPDFPGFKPRSPDNRGKIRLMQTNARLAPEARISGEAWVADRIIRLVGDTTAVDEGRLLYCP